MIRDAVLFVVGVVALFAFTMAFLLMMVDPKDHTHPPTGIQAGAEVCVAGEAAIDYDINTSRPFIVCGKISLADLSESSPPLGSNTHLAQ